MFGGSKAVWKKRKMELVPSSSDDVGPVLRCTKTKGSGDKKEALFQIVLEGCTVRDDDAKPTKKAAAFAINHATYTEPKVFYADGNDERDKWTEQLKAAVADYKESLAKEAESAPAEVAKKTETIKKARRASLTLEESVAPALFKYIRRSLRMWLRRAKSHAAEMTKLAEEGGRLDAKAAVEMAGTYARQGVRVGVIFTLGVRFRRPARMPVQVQYTTPTK